jgi:hypothetical protein
MEEVSVFPLEGGVGEVPLEAVYGGMVYGKPKSEVLICLHFKFSTLRFKI